LDISNKTREQLYEEIEELKRKISELEKFKTESRKAEKKFHTSEQYLKEAEIIGGFGYWNINFITGKTECSENYYRLFGYEPFEFEVSFEKFKTRIYPEDLQIFEEGFRKIQKEKKRMKFEFRIIKKDGAIAWHKYNVVPEFENDKLVILRGTTYDFTELKLAKEKLRETLQRYKGIFDESIAAVYIIDAEKNFIDSNPAGLELLGYSKEELLSMNIVDVDADPIKTLPIHKQLLAGGKIINYG